MPSLIILFEWQAPKIKFILAAGQWGWTEKAGNPGCRSQDPNHIKAFAALLHVLSLLVHMLGYVGYSCLCLVESLVQVGTYFFLSLTDI